MDKYVLRLVQSEVKLSQEVALHIPCRIFYNA